MSTPWHLAPWPCGHNDPVFVNAFTQSCAVCGERRSDETHVAALATIEKCAESDYDLPTCTPAQAESALNSWLAGDFAADVREAIDVLGLGDAVRLYIAAYDEAHRDEYDLDENGNPNATEEG